MFEPSIPTEETRIAVSLPIVDSIDFGTFISPEVLSPNQLTTKSFDALMISGLSLTNEQDIAVVCEKVGTLFIVFHNPSNDELAINEAMINIIGKLYSHELPNNIDLADLKNLKLRSNLLYAFNDSRSALKFLATQTEGKVTGAIYLSHGRTGMSECEKICNELLSHISQHSTLCFSTYGRGHSECTILLGIR